MTGPAAERPLVFRCRGHELAGILHPGDDGATRGVVIVVGGPQYRVGSHRQFVLLARALAGGGTPVLRFDYRGLGDSDGELQDFEAADPDIEAAIDAFREAVPTVTEVVLWGLCDAASAASFRAGADRRIAGLVLANPWVRTESGQARAELRHYYLGRLAGRDFWRKLLTLRWNPLASLRSLARSAGRALRRDGDSPAAGRAPLPERVRAGLEAFEGPVLLILSGRDLTAREFEDAVAASPAWRAWRERENVTERRLEPADHTFSRAEWRDRVAGWTLDWLRSW